MRVYTDLVNINDQWLSGFVTIEPQRYAIFVGMDVKWDTCFCSIDWMSKRITPIEIESVEHKIPCKFHSYIKSTLIILHRYMVTKK